VFFATVKLPGKWKNAARYSALLFFIGAMGYWDMMNQTLTIILASVLISLAIGFPLGILVASGGRADAVVRPILDTMQTMPSFVYMIPAAMLLGLGNAPAVIATTIYAMPPMVRLTSHGIRQVDVEVVEAARAFGSTRFQTLWKVQIPQALPTIMTGVNQTIMMAIAMVVTCAMIGAISLGSEVLQGINRLAPGQGFAGGIAIVIMAVILDRITQGLFKKDGEAE
jgi:ABC-type proline/glycine betaine transport system permease subunit